MSVYANHSDVNNNEIENDNDNYYYISESPEHYEEQLNVSTNDINFNNVPSDILQHNIPSNILQYNIPSNISELEHEEQQSLNTNIINPNVHNSMTYKKSQLWLYILLVILIISLVVYFLIDNKIIKFPMSGGNTPPSGDFPPAAVVSADEIAVDVPVPKDRNGMSPCGNSRDSP